MQSWMYPTQPCCHWMLSMDSSSLLPPWTLSNTSSIGFTLCIAFRWPSNITLFMALTLVDSIAPVCYLGEPSLSIHGPLGCLLLSITLPCWERRPITRLVNLLLTSESVESKPYSLGKAYLKVGLSSWWALVNCSLSLSCVDSPRCFSSPFCKIESVCLIRLARVFH
jgi:hypothetical protein